MELEAFHSDKAMHACGSSRVITSNKSAVTRVTRVELEAPKSDRAMLAEVGGVWNASSSSRATPITKLWSRDGLEVRGELGVPVSDRAMRVNDGGV